MTKAKKKPAAKKTKRWLFPVLAIPLIGIALLLALSAAVLSHAGEYVAAEDIADRLTVGTGVYGPALSPRIVDVKEKLYARVAPDIVALGSARIDQFRAEDFSQSFVNLSGAETLDEVTRLCTQLFAAKKPKAVILALDDWWFHGDGNAAVSLRAPESGKPSTSGFVALAGLYAAGGLSISDVKTILTSSTDDRGINGILHGDGFDRSGAYAYRSIWTGAAPSPDKLFVKSRDSIAQGGGVFAWGDDVAPDQWQKLTGLLDFLQQQNIAVFIFLPPVAPTVLDAMAASGKYGYVNGLRLKVSELAAAYHMPLFDDHDIRFAGSNDCEFIDGLHPGAIALKRALLDMAMKEPSMRELLKLPEIGWAIEHAKGQASALAGEADFLGLGCRKTPANP